MMPHSKTNWHHTCANNHDTGRSPDSISWICPPKMSRTELLPCKITDYFLHGQSVNICKCIAYTF